MLLISVVQLCLKRKPFPRKVLISEEIKKCFFDNKYHHKMDQDSLMWFLIILVTMQIKVLRLKMGRVQLMCRGESKVVNL